MALPLAFSLSLMAFGQVPDATPPGPPLPASGFALLCDGTRRDLGPCQGTDGDGRYFFSQPCLDRASALPPIHEPRVYGVTALGVRFGDGSEKIVVAEDFKATGTSYYRGLPVRVHGEVISGSGQNTVHHPAQYAPGTIRAYISFPKRGSIR